MSTNETSSSEPGSTRLDFHLGVAVAIVAALVAIVDLVNGRFDNAELEAVEEKASTFTWFQAKSIKEGVAAGEGDMLRALRDSGVIAAGDNADAAIARVDAAAARYEAEKAPILETARALDKRAALLDRSGDILDVAELMLHIALLLGGVGVAVQHKPFERVMLRIVVVLAVLGVVGLVIGLAVYFASS